MIGYTNMKLGLADVLQLNHDFEPWLYILDTDLSDLIEISDVTRTVYISLVLSQGRPPVANVFSRLSANRNVFSLLSFSDYPTIKQWKFEGGQITVTYSFFVKSK